jgi:6-phosphogluconolactonase
MVRFARTLAGLVTILGAVCFVGGCRSSGGGDQSMAQSRSNVFWMYVGTYTKSTSRGIYLFKFDADAGKLTPQGLACEAVDPNFLAVSPDQRFLYSCASANGGRDGVIDSFTIDPTSGRLALLNQQPSGGRGPTFISLDSSGRNAVVANYTAGTVAVLPIDSDGQLQRPSDVIQHAGSSVNPARQDSAHPHACDFDLNKKFVFVPDLGMDKIFVYQMDSAAGKLIAADPPTVGVPPGQGPRHMAFHPNGRFAYLINEMGGTVVAYSYDAPNGRLKDIQTVSTLPDDFNATNTAAEIQVHPSGKFLYASNRGHDSIAIFALDPGTGLLHRLAFQSTLGKGPRFFCIDPTGKYLIVANQDSRSVIFFRINPLTGMLSLADIGAEVAMPVSIVFLPAPN